MKKKKAVRQEVGLETGWKYTRKKGARGTRPYGSKKKQEG